MVNTSEEMMLTLQGRDMASNVFANVDRNAQSMASNISSAFSKLNTGMMNLSQVSDNMMQSLTGKSAMDNILGSASKNETNMVLLENMLEDTEKNYESFYKTVDSTTDASLTSMQELIPALNALNAATGATDKELENITPNVANFGASVLAQTGSVDRAQQAMMDLSKGYKGAFASLDQYGITEDALSRAGYNEGDGLEKYMDAVTKVVGSTDKLMETNQGLDALIGKSFSRAGKKIGNEFLPIIKDVKRGFIDLDSEMGGAIASTILIGSASVDTGNRIFWNVSTAINGVKDLADAFKFVTTAIKGAGDAAEATGDAINTISNVSDMGAGAAGVGGAVGAGAQAGKTVSKGEKAAEAGVGAVSTADMLKDLKSKNKYDEEAIKEAISSVKSTERLTDEVDKAQDAEGKLFDLMSKKDAAQANIDSGIFGSGMRKQFSKQVTEANDEMDKIIGTDLWNGVKTSKANVSKVKGESNNLWKYYEDVFDGQEQAMSNAEKVSAKFGFKDKGGIGVFRELAEETSSSRQEASKVLTGLDDLKDAQDEIQWGMDYTQSGFFDKLRMRKDKGVSGNISDAFTGIKNFFKGADDVADVVDEAADVGKTLEGAGEIAIGMEAAAGAGEAATVAGPAMEAGAAGAETAAVGATSLSAAFTSMIVPLLALSAVIMIMIPIAAVIAAEAMIILRLLGELMQALNFDSINLDGAVKGISQITTALLWVGAAMLALAAVNIATSIAMVTSFFTGLTGPISMAVDALKKVGSLLQGFNSVKIDKSVATNIKAISDSLMAISSAMVALTWGNIVTGISDWIAGALGFGSVTDGLEQAKNDIMTAANKLNEFSSMTPLDESVATNIQNVCDSLASVGNAMSALRSMRDSQNWDSMIGDFLSGIFGEGVDIQTALMNVKDDIVKASQALSQFTGISDIPEDVSTKIQKVSDTLTKVNDTVTTLKDMVGSGFDNWVDGLFGGHDIIGGLEKIKTDLITSSQKLAELTGVSEIGDDVGEKIQKVGDTLGKVSEVAGTMTSVPDMGDFDPATISTAVTNIQTAATELAKLNETTFDGESADTMLGAIQTTLENVKTTLSGASGFTEAATGIGTQIVSGVQSSLSPLTGTIQSAVNSATGAAASNGWTGGSKIGTSTTNGMKSALQLKSTMDTEVGYALQAITSREQEFYNAGANLGNAANRGFQSHSAINPGSPGNLAHVMMDEVDYILDAMKSKYGAVYTTAAGLGKSIYQGFGNSTLDFDMFSNGGELTAEHIGALQTTVSNAPEKADNRPVTIIIEEGAFSMDVRNHTVQEAQRLVITALEGMDHITNVEVDNGG